MFHKWSFETHLVTHSNGRCELTYAELSTHDQITEDTCCQQGVFDGQAVLLNTFEWNSLVNSSVSGFGFFFSQFTC